MKKIIGMPNAQVHGADIKPRTIRKSLGHEIKDYKKIRKQVRETIGTVFPEYNNLIGITPFMSRKMREEFGVTINLNKDFSKVFVAKNSTILATFSFEFNGGIWCLPYRKYQNAKADLFALNLCLK